MQERVPPSARTVSDGGPAGGFKGSGAKGTEPGEVPAGAKPGPGATRAPIRWGVLFRLGRRYLGAHPLLTATYALGLLLTLSVLPVAAATYYGQLTNFFQGGQAGAGKAERANAAKRPAASVPDASVPAPAVGSAAPAASVESPSSSIADAHARLQRTYVLWVALVLGSAALLFGQRYLAGYCEAVISSRIRADVFAALMQQSSRYYHEHSAEELTVIVNQLAKQTYMALRQLLVDPVAQVVGIVVVAGSLYASLLTLGGQKGPDVYALFAAVAAFVMISPLLVVWVGRRLQQQVATVQRQQFALATLVGGALKAPEEIQVMRAQSLFATKHEALLADTMRATLRETVTMESLNLLNSLPGSLVLIALIGVAILLLFQGPSNATPETIVKVALLTPTLMGAVQGLTNFTIQASMTWPAVEAVVSVLDGTSEVSDAPEAQAIDRITPTIEARDVVFSYQPGALPNVLDRVSFRIPAGQITGLIARPGRGKTTFFRLLLRFYRPLQGQVLVGGHPVDAFTLDSLRRHIGLMSQEPAFFYDTVRENFRVAKPEATDAEVQQLCERTEMWPILEQAFGSRPLDAEFAAGGKISGGQKKLFALTRLLLQAPSILLLDEPTTGMGPLEKFPLAEQLRRVCQGRTVVSVEHDIVWQTRFCDYFLVLDRGKIVQEGTADQLMANEGLFRELCESSRNGKLKDRTGPPSGGAERPGDVLAKPAALGR